MNHAWQGLVLTGCMIWLCFFVWAYCLYKIANWHPSNHKLMQDANPPDENEKRLRKWWHP